MISINLAYKTWKMKFISCYLAMYVFLQMGENSVPNFAFITKVTQRHIVNGSWTILEASINVWTSRGYDRLLLLAAETKANSVLRNLEELKSSTEKNLSSWSFPRSLASECPLRSTVEIPFYKINPNKSISEHL